MMKSLIYRGIIIVVLSMGSVSAIPAFPGAQGWGATATGGRGGAVYEVTNLNDSGAGSLRAALNHNTPRTIVFRVSGTIHLNSDLPLYYGNVTIAGQTAPGDGICIANGSLKLDANPGYNNVIIRYIRCRLGDHWPNGTENGDSDAAWGRHGNTIIFDHVSASWSIDETFSFYVNNNFTAQWCIISESLYRSHHEKGNHGYGGIWGSTNSSWHHNLLAHHTSRNPRIDGEITDNVDMRNNVIYNWGGNSCYGGEYATVNIVNCYYKYGPNTGSTVRDRIAQPSADTPHVYGQWYITGNYVYGYPTVTANNWIGVDPDGGSQDIALCRSLTPFEVATTYPVTEQTAEEAYNYVLQSAGCSLIRDSADTRVVNDVINGTGQIIDCVEGNNYYYSRGTARGGTSNTITFASTASSYDDFCNGRQIEILTGTGAGQIRTISDYTGSTKIAKVSSNWSTIPDATSTYGVIVNCAKNAGGWPILNSLAAPADSDHDGMPDDWELMHNLNPDDASDRNGDYNDDGYTNLEKYVNGLCPDPYYICTNPIASDFHRNCQVDFLDYSMLANGYFYGIKDFADLAQFAEDWLICNRDPAEECWN